MLNKETKLTLTSFRDIWMAPINLVFYRVSSELENSFVCPNFPIIKHVATATASHAKVMDLFGVAVQKDEENRKM